MARRRKITASRPPRRERAAQLSGPRKAKAKRSKTRRHQGGVAGWLRKALLGLLVFLFVAPALVLALYIALPPPVTPLMLLRLPEEESLDYRWRSLDEISPHLARAVIAAEDNRFCEHSGFDFSALQAVFEEWRAGERPRGASTISMQTTKNVLLWPNRHALRKLAEAWLTPQLELLWSKNRILEIYLNVIEMGPGIYGAEAAAQQYFGKPAKALSQRQAALLAAALPNPRVLSPAAPSDYLLERADVIETRMGQLGPLLDCAAQN